MPSKVFKMYLIKLLDTYSKLFNSRIKSFTIDISLFAVVLEIVSRSFSFVYILHILTITMLL